MNCDFRTIRWANARRRGFTLMEAVAALGVLLVIVTGVLVVVNRSMAAMVDNRSRVLAFELARENMERLLGSDTVTDMSEFGVHELDEDIQWQNVVETFSEPVNSGMWIRAVCSASYTDRNGERQTIELTHWITDLTKTQEKQILDQKRREQEFLDQMDGNPFGDDPDGLLQYADALAEMGELDRAAQAASELILTYPGEPQAANAWRKLLGYPELALADGDTTTAAGIVDLIETEHGDRAEADKLKEKLQPYIELGVPYYGGRRGASGGTSGGPTGGSTNTGGGQSGAGGGGNQGGSGGSSGQGGSGGQNTGSGSGQPRAGQYPNPNWTPEQKQIWDMFMELERSRQ